MRLCPSIFDVDVLAVYVTCRTERLSERTHTKGIGFGRTDSENADHRHGGLLRTHRNWPTGRRAAEQRDERAPLQASEIHSVPLPPG